MKPENRFIGNVHKKLHPDVYREKMHNPLRGGTPDVYYMGYRDDLWVEYKWEPKFPKKHLTPDLSGLQKVWLERAHDRGRKPWCVVGSPTGSIVLTDPRHWHQGIGMDEARVISIADLATEIQSRCGLESSPAAASQRKPSTPPPSSAPSPGS